MKILFLLLAFLPLSAGCRSRPASPSAPAAAGPERALDWTLGRWRGARVDAGDGSRGELRMEVTQVLGGAGQRRAIEIVHDSGTYLGFCVQVYVKTEDLWRRHYVNDVRRSFASLEGIVEPGRSVWRSVSPGRKRESRVVSTRPGPDRWLRVMTVSSDGGTSWRELWRDELERVD